MKRVAMIAAAMLLVLGACGNNDSDDGAAAPDDEAGAATAQTFTVEVDGDSDAFNGEFAGFFPSQLKAHAGDEVTFALPRFSGVPHTVTFGTLVDAAMEKFRKLPPTTTIAGSENFAEMQKLTDVFPHKTPPGPPSPNQAAAQACYLKTGEPPNSLTGGAPACPKTAQPDFDGTYAFYNSGLLAADGDKFSMTLTDDVKPGSYSFMCLIHRGGMSGIVEVVSKDADVPTPAEVTKAGEAEFARVETAGKAAAKAGEAATADKALAGAGDPTVPALIVAEFLPKSISIPVGGTVAWNVFAFHSVTFNAKDSDIGVLAKAPDGSWSFPPSGAPSGFTVPPEAGEFPPADDAKPLLIDGGKWDGAGPRSTGIVGSLPPRFITVKQSFTKAGTYTVRCLVHPDMKAEVKVG